jgi:hypothetical protein
MPEK